MAYITNFDHTTIDLNDQKFLLTKQKNGEHAQVVMIERHVTRQKKRSSEGARMVTITLRDH